MRRPTVRNTTASTVLVLAFGMILMACSNGSSVAPSEESGERTVSGLIHLVGKNGISYGSGLCEGNVGYDDLHDGTQVVIRDGTGTIVGVSDVYSPIDHNVETFKTVVEVAEQEMIANGFTEDEAKGFKEVNAASSDLGITTSVGCDLAFDVTVPDADFYTVEVSHRGEVAVSAIELQDSNWRLSLSIGD